MFSLTSFSHDKQDPWQTSQSYQHEGLGLSTAQFLEITNLLLTNPNLNSSHLFRADILFDSSSALQTPTQKEKSLYYLNSAPPNQGNSEYQPANRDLRSEIPTTVANLSAEFEHKPSQASWPDFQLQRTVIRKLIPRKPQLDRVLEQLCLIYVSKSPKESSKGQSWLVVYYPRVPDEVSMPWYHPSVRALAYLYVPLASEATLSVHYLPFKPTLEPVPSRLNRTMLSLLQRFIRLAKHPSRAPAPSNDGFTGSEPAERSLAFSDLKDTIIPQHHVQDTYTRLKQTYAADLIARWVEKTEPSKHVFEDLAIAAFLTELWKQMYASIPFPGFVDIACGNGVLVYVLRREGYRGFGFDARGRKTWEVLGMDEYLREQVCMPKPFLDVLGLDTEDGLLETKFHNGIFQPGTFIISNHADELTPWTPILAALSSPQAPLPFLAIPCCSHALSGARHRYSPKDARSISATVASVEEEQPVNGDLKALRASKAEVATHSDDKSMYSCLTRKVVGLAEELGFDVELTLMRIPSTRNIGIVGDRRRVMKGRDQTLSNNSKDQTSNGHQDRNSLEVVVPRLIRRECARLGELKSRRRYGLRARGNYKSVRAEGS